VTAAKRLVGLLALCALAGCSALYTLNPRYGGRHAGTRPLGKPPPKPTHPLTTRRGSLPWPARGPVVRPFGTIVDPKYKTTTRSPGLDILAGPNAPVTAVDSGVVSYADAFMGYGRMVILDHGGRYHSIYSRLEEIKVSVGQAVKRQDTIALSGDTLHFEFRVGGKSVDPLDWLAPR
jgi:septal ring factor EnvC (AmiA/AmiB activator)